MRIPIPSIARALLIAAALSVPAGTATANPHDKARYAATYPGLEMQRDLDAVLASGFDVNTRYSSPEGWTLLHFAAQAANAEMARYLLTRGADPTLTDADGRTPLEVTYSEATRAVLRDVLGTTSQTAPPAAPKATPMPAAAPPAASATQAPQPGPEDCDYWYTLDLKLCGMSASICRVQAHQSYKDCKRTGSYF